MPKEDSKYRNLKCASHNNEDLSVNSLKQDYSDYEKCAIDPKQDLGKVLNFDRDMWLHHVINEVINSGSLRTEHKSPYHFSQVQS